jgi:hypothetical protein
MTKLTDLCAPLNANMSAFINVLSLALGWAKLAGHIICHSYDKISEV